MIHGFVDDVGVPMIPLRIADSDLFGIVDSGFNGDLELPDKLRETTPAQYQGTLKSHLAGGQTITEHWYLIEMQFDEQWVEVVTTFAPTEMALVGTRLMQDHYLQIDFVHRTVTLKRTQID